jgi:predicted nucleotidyltransferase
VKDWNEIVQLVLSHYPQSQAIYLFGSYGTEQERPESDADIALLLPPKEARKAQSLMLGDLHSDLESLLNKEVDLINLRLVSTVLQKEIIAADRRIYTGDHYAAEEFEMLTLSYYQKLNEERAEIINGALADGRFHLV